jgi:hypothetical protein
LVHTDFEKTKNGLSAPSSAYNKIAKKEETSNTYYNKY